MCDTLSKRATGMSLPMEDNRILEMIDEEHARLRVHTHYTSPASLSLEAGRSICVLVLASETPPLALVSPCPSSQCRLVYTLPPTS